MSYIFRWCTTYIQNQKDLMSKIPTHVDEITEQLRTNTGMLEFVEKARGIEWRNAGFR